MTKVPEYNFSNLTVAQQNCLSLIETLGIYELRALARVFGDNSPTVSKRDNHINVIMTKIISGEDLKAIPMRPGRPYKELSNIEGILAELSQITGKDYSIKNTQTRRVNFTQKVVTFKQLEENIFSQKLQPIQVRGVLMERNAKEYILIDSCTNATVLVKKAVHENVNAFDFITGTAVIMNKENEYILEEIETINFVPYVKYEERYNPYEICNPSESLNFQQHNILLGSRYVMKDLRLTENADEIRKLVETLKQNKIICLALVPNVMPEDLQKLNTIGFDNVFVSKYDDRPLTVNENLNNYINHVIRLQQLGYNLALFVQDITILADAVDFVFKTNTKALMGHTEMAIETIKKLILLAKAGGQNKHTTMFTTFDEADMFDQMFVSSVYKVSKRF